MIKVDYRIDWQLFAKAMKENRQGRGITQSQFGTVMGVSKSMVSRWETMKCFCTVEQFLYVCWLFRLDTFEFLLLGENSIDNGSKLDSLYMELK